jgi:excisionase family DNA binding protein
MEELTTEEIAQRTGKTKRTVQRWIASGQLATEPLSGNRYAVHAVDLEELSQPDHATKNFQPRTRMPSYDELYDKYIHLQFEVEDLEERVRYLEARLDQVLSRPVRSTPTRTTTKRKKRDARKYLPWDYTPWRPFATMHNIPHSAVKKAVEQGQLSVERGNWKFGGVSVKEAFNSYECQLFYTHFHHLARFEPCIDCPHQG